MDNTYTETEIYRYQLEQLDFIPKSRQVSQVRKDFKIMNKTGVQQMQWDTLMDAVQRALRASPLASKLLSGPKGNKIKFLEVYEEMHLVDMVARLEQLQNLTDEPRKYARWFINQYGPRAPAGADHTLMHRMNANGDATTITVPGQQNVMVGAGEH